MLTARSPWVRLLLLCTILLGSADQFWLNATDVPGPDSTSWTVVASWWCYKTTKVCQELDENGDSSSSMENCSIPSTGYYTEEHAGAMCIES
jgi:hypothetical protein